MGGVVAIVTFAARAGDAVACSMTSAKGYRLELAGALRDAEPAASGSPHLVANHALVNNLWAYAKFEKHRRKTRSQDKRQSFAKHAAAHAKTAEQIADLLDYGAGDRKVGWCSGCLTKSEHTRLLLPSSALPAYICQACGSPTLTCAVPGCNNMASRGSKKTGIPHYCAEHRHETPGFEKASLRISDLSEWASIFAYDKPNYAKGTRMGLLAALGLATVATAGFAAAPAIGGAVGSLVGGYSGAAATSYGLALLGGGSIASGGLGMVGGTAVITTAGAALGSGLGLSVANAYVGTDKSFRIEKVREGSGVAVVLANGFLTERSDSWERWKDLIDRAYPDAPVYRVHWGAKELADLEVFLGWGAAKGAVIRVATKGALQASKRAVSKLAPASAPFFVADLAANPWHTAKNRADQTGVALATVLARVDEGAFTLVGHSLGGRVMVRAAQTLGMRAGSPPVREVHLLGAAVAAGENWGTLRAGTTGAISNYHSTRDPVLKHLYTAAQAGSRAAGLVGLRGALPGMHNHDCTRRVERHDGYFSAVRLRTEDPR
jgi:hypothetical protein